MENIVTNEKELYEKYQEEELKTKKFLLDTATSKIKEASLLIERVINNQL